MDFETGNIYNFGISLGAKVILNLYKSDSTGKVIQQSTYPLEGLRLVHDFVLAGPYLIFFVPPIRVKLLPTALGLSSLSDAMQWKPEVGTEILIFDRETLSLVSKGKTDPWFQWHYSNGYVNDNNNIIIEFVRYEDFATNHNLKEIGIRQLKTPAKGTLWEVEINPKTSQVIRQEQ